MQAHDLMFTSHLATHTCIPKAEFQFNLFVAKLPHEVRKLLFVEKARFCECVSCITPGATVDHQQLNAIRSMCEPYMQPRLLQAASHHTRIVAVAQWQFMSCSLVVLDSQKLGSWVVRSYSQLSSTTLSLGLASRLKPSSPARNLPTNRQSTDDAALCSIFC